MDNNRIGIMARLSDADDAELTLLAMTMDVEEVEAIEATDVRGLPQS